MRVIARRPSCGAAVRMIVPVSATATVQPVMTLDNSGNAGQSGGADGLFLDTIDGPDPITGNFCSSANRFAGLVVLANDLPQEQFGLGIESSAGLIEKNIRALETRGTELKPVGRGDGGAELLEGQEMRIETPPPNDVSAGGRQGHLATAGQ